MEGVSEGVWLARAEIKLTLKSVLKKGMFGREKEKMVFNVDMTGAGGESQQEFDLNEGEVLSITLPGAMLLDADRGMKALEFLGRDT